MRGFAARVAGSKAVYTFDRILGDSPPLMEVIDQAKTIARGNTTVLILGESGTGKELFAQSIHNASSRASRPFVAVNCGALPRNLVESELFGYEDGAFTGASRTGKPGKFELADGGTIFLDELGEMPMDAQVSLLRLLQNGEVTRIGGKSSRTVSVRVIAATNKNLEEAVRQHTFREDLYYRLNVFTLVLPPLRSRMSDIELLAEHFLLKFAGSLGKWLQSRIVSGNFDMASGGLERAAAFIVPNRALTKKVCSGLGEPDPVLLVSRPTGLVRGFVQQSFSAHANDATAQKLSCAALGAAVAAAVVCGVRAKDAFDALSGFAGALCVIMPLASSLVYAMPALRLHRAASQVGAVIPGPSAIGELGRVNTILLSAKDLFPAACVRLHGIKTFEKERIDLAILYATSILAQQCDTLRDTFMTLVDNKKEVLYKLESPQTEPGFGFTAWIDHKRIIIGSREMMKRHDVEIPVDGLREQIHQKRADGAHLHGGSRQIVRYVPGQLPPQCRCAEDSGSPGAKRHQRAGAVG